jgi:hypothetical protein
MSHTNPQPQSRNLLNAESQIPWTRIQLDTLTPWQRSRLVGAIIINRHSRNGTFDRLSAGAIRMLISMADIFGVAMENCAGMVIRKLDAEKEVALRIRLCRAIGLGEQSNYAPIRELEEQGIIQRVKFGSRKGDDFVLIMPPEPLSGSPEMTIEALRENNVESPARQSSNAGCARGTLQEQNLALQNNSPDYSAMLDARAGLDSSFVESDSEIGTSDARASCNAASSHVCMNDNDHACMHEEAALEEEQKETASQLLACIKYGGKIMDAAGRSSLLKLSTTSADRILEAKAEMDSRMRKGSWKGKPIGNPIGMFFGLVRDGIEKDDPKPVRSPDPAAIAQQEAGQRLQQLRQDVTALGTEELNRRVTRLSEIDSKPWQIIWKSNLPVPDPKKMVARQLDAILTEQPTGTKKEVSSAN